MIARPGAMPSRPIAPSRLPMRNSPTGIRITFQTLRGHFFGRDLRKVGTPEFSATRYQSHRRPTPGRALRSLGRRAPTPAPDPGPTCSATPAVDVLACPRGGGRMRVIATIDDPVARISRRTRRRGSSGRPPRCRCRPPLPWGTIRARPAWSLVP